MQHTVESQYPFGDTCREISSPKEAKPLETLIQLEMEAVYLNLMLVRVNLLALSGRA